MGHDSGVLNSPFYSNVGLCTQQSTQECWYADGSSGDNVYTKAWDSTYSNERWDLTLADVCNGGYLVTDTCPFQTGTGLNSYYAGADIFEVTEHSASSICADGYLNTGQSGGYEVQQGGCDSGDGYLWVQTIDSSGDFHFVNVKESNGSSPPGVLACEYADNAVLQMSGDCPNVQQAWQETT